MSPHIHSAQFLGLILEGLVFGDFLALLVMCDKDNFSVSLKNPHFFLISYSYGAFFGGLS